MKGSFGREDGADMVYFPRKETLRFIFDNQAEHGRWTVLFFLYVLEDEHAVTQRAFYPG